MHSEKFIQSLIDQTKQITEQAEQLFDFDIALLTWKENPDAWCVLECLEHLNLYGDFYLPQIAKSIEDSKFKSQQDFKSGMLGKYFSGMMLPKEKMKKIKTFKDKNPLNANLEITSLTRFIDQQDKFILLLSKARKVSLNRIKVTTSIASFIRLKLGDVFQFIVNHNLRHMKQIERILTEAKNEILVSGN